jgi:MFS family permease
MDLNFVALLVVLATISGVTFGTGYIADRKGRSFIAWAALGFVLGVFGLLLAAIVPTKKPSYQD